MSLEPWVQNSNPGGWVPWRLVQDGDTWGLQGEAGSSGSHGDSGDSGVYCLSHLGHGHMAPPKKNIGENYEVWGALWRSGHLRAFWRREHLRVLWRRGQRNGPWKSGHRNGPWRSGNLRALARSGLWRALLRSGLWSWAPTHTLISHQ